ncbi:MAG TPA: hypothetical protein DDY78_27125, partial [Planctomycetales bacterium]|nr:hypothetical protein [Planctomycetales bacterium]
NEDLPGLTRRWRGEGHQAGAGAEDYARWLAANQYLTEYQAGVLLRDGAGPFFLNEYKLLDRLGVGRMAGVFKAQHRLGQIVAVKVLPTSKAKDATHDPVLQQDEGIRPVAVERHAPRRTGLRSQA